MMLPRFAQADETAVLTHRIIHERREDLDPIINRLVYLDCDESAEAVARLLFHRRASVRSKAAWILGFLEAPHTRGSLRRAVNDPHWEVRRDAVYALGELSATEAADAIGARLMDTSREVRLEAARVLGSLGADSAKERLRDSLARTDDDPEMEVALITALGEVEDEEAASLFRERLKSDSEDVHLAALRALARLGDESSSELIIKRLQHTEPNIRRDAALLLADVDAEWSRRALEAALASEDDAWVALGMAEALTARGGEAGLRHLAEVSATSSDKGLAQQAVEALGRLEVRGDELAEVRRRMALRRLESLERPLETLAAELMAFELPFEERIEAISGRFKGVPYMNAPLGEGAGVDPGPLFRWDAVDCLTLVEQVIALAHVRRPEDVLPILIDIRYQGGVVSFGERNHLMEHQWLPNSVSKGWLRDITEEVGGDLVEAASKTITKESWERRRGVSLPLNADEIPLGTSKIPIIPLDRFREVMDRIPSGAILVVVRNDFQSRPFRVTHLGFVIERGGRRFLRHAARATYESVIDELLETFVRRNESYKGWPVSGFHILLPEENLERADALTDM